MINVHRMVSGFGKLAEVETIEYCYPFSLIKLRYDIGKGIKIKHAKVGFNSKGIMTMHTKNPIPKDAQKFIKLNLVNIQQFITKWADLD